MTALFSLSGDREDTASAPVQDAIARVDPVTAAPHSPPQSPPQAPAALVDLAPPASTELFVPETRPLPELDTEPEQGESGFRFRLAIEDKPRKTLARLRRTDARRHARVLAALRELEAHGPTWPRLQTKKLQDQPEYPKDTWQSYVENGTPSAWRVHWCYGEPGELIVHAIGPHR